MKSSMSGRPIVCNVCGIIESLLQANEYCPEHGSVTLDG